MNLETLESWPWQVKSSNPLVKQSNCSVNKSNELYAKFFRHVDVYDVAAVRCGLLDVIQMGLKWALRLYVYFLTTTPKVLFYDLQHIVKQLFSVFCFSAEVVING